MSEPPSNMPEPPSNMSEPPSNMSEPPSDMSEPTSNMSEHNYKFNVQMSCGGCSGAVERVLKKLDGVKSYNVSLDTQTADVITTDELSYDTVLKKIKNTGKTVVSGEADGVVMAVA